MANFAEMIKRAAMDAVKASKPATILYGEVVTTSPLKIKVADNISLGREHLIVPERLTDYEVNMEYDEPVGDSFVHRRILYTVRSALKVGDKVILVRDQGGQRFLIVDRLEGNG